MTAVLCVAGHRGAARHLGGVKRCARPFRTQRFPALSLRASLVPCTLTTDRPPICDLRAGFRIADGTITTTTAVAAVAAAVAATAASSAARRRFFVDLGRLVVRPFRHEKAASMTLAADRAALAAAGTAHMIAAAWAPIAASVWAPAPPFMAVQAAVPASFWHSHPPDRAAAGAASEAAMGFRWQAQRSEGRRESARRRCATAGVA